MCKNSADRNKTVASLEGRQDLDESRAVSFSENLATTYSISDLYEFVKMFDEEFTPAPEISPITYEIKEKISINI